MPGRRIAFVLALLVTAPALAQAGPSAPAPIAGPDDTPPAAAADTGDLTAPPKPFTLTTAITATSDYRFRGLTQSGGDPAVQGTVNVDSTFGVYAGAWASTIDGGRRGRTPLRVGYGSEEIDLYAGYTRRLNGLGVDAGLLYYYFASHRPGVNTDFFEPYASLSYTIGPIAAKVGANYAWAGQKGLDIRPNNSDANLYVYTEGSIGIPRTPLSLRGHLGRTQGSLGLANLNPADAGYLDWSVTGEAVGGPIKVGVSYVDTSITDRGGFARRLGRGSTVIGYVGLSF